MCRDIPVQRMSYILIHTELTRSRKHNVFFACGSVEETPYYTHIFAYGENVGVKETKYRSAKGEKAN